MFSIPYPTPTENLFYQRQAHRMRSAVVAGLVRDLIRLLSAAAR